MTSLIPKLDRRTLIKGAAALGAFQVTSPFIIQARGETAIRIGMVDPLTGVYAAPAGNDPDGGAGFSRPCRRHFSYR